MHKNMCALGTMARLFRECDGTQKQSRVSYFFLHKQLFGEVIDEVLYISAMNIRALLPHRNDRPS